jgi:hypothetical protein
MRDRKQQRFADTQTMCSVKCLLTDLIGAAGARMVYGRLEYHKSIFKAAGTIGQALLLSRPLVWVRMCMFSLQGCHGGVYQEMNTQASTAIFARISSLSAFLRFRKAIYNHLQNLMTNREADRVVLGVVFGR